MVTDLVDAVILITGVMAAGKSTVSQLLAERFVRAAHVRGDIFRRFVVTGGAEPSPSMPTEAQDQLVLRYWLAASTADAYAQAGFVAVVQDIIVGPVLTEVIEMFTTDDLFLVVLDPAPAAIEEREVGRRKTGYTSTWTPTELVTELRTSTPRVGLWLDTTECDERQTVDLILQRLEEARIIR